MSDARMHDTTAHGTGAHGSAPPRTGPAGSPLRSTDRGSGTTLLVIAKEPVPGRAKTRLTPPFSPGEAAALAEASLADTLTTVRRLPARRRVLVLEGRPGPWLPEGFDVVPQAEGGLDERIAAAFALCEDGPALLVGMDTPQITPRLLAPVTGAGGWDDCDAWFGPAADGGFWALGMAAPRPELVRGVPMSTGRTGRLQRQRLVDAGLSVRDLPVLRDVDTADDAADIARALAQEAGEAGTAGAGSPGDGASAARGARAPGAQRAPGAPETGPAADGHVPGRFARVHTELARAVQR